MSTDSETNIDDEVFEGTEEEVIASDSETNDSEINDFEDITISTTSTTEDLSMVKVASSSETNNMFLTATDSDVFPASLSELLQKLQLASTSEVISTESNINASLFGAVNAKTGKRPIWIQSHHCNSRGEVQKALNAGCNAIEIDILYKDSEGKKRGRSKNVGYPKPTNYWLAHNKVYMWLDMTIAEIIEDAWRCKSPTGEHLCFIMLDIKNASDIPGLSKEIHDVYDYYYIKQNEQLKYIWNNLPPEIRNNPLFALSNPDNFGKKLYIIYSTADSKYIDWFNPNGVGGPLWPGPGLQLRENEGVCIDQSTNTDFIASKFKEWGYDRCWFGNGYDGNIPWAGEYMHSKHKLPSIKRAVELRDKGDTFKKVESWTFVSIPEVEESLFDWKCDSVMIADWIRDQSSINRIKSYFPANNCYMATIDDNPFERAPKYNVDWFAEDGTLLCSQDYSIGDMPSYAPPEISGKIFSGWKNRADGSIGYKPVARNTQYIATYIEDTIKPNYTVTFHCGSYAYERTYEEGDNVVVPDISYYIEDGYKFDGWYEESTYVNKVVTFPPVTSDKDYYAKVDQKKKHLITFTIGDKSFSSEWEHGVMPTPPDVTGKIPAGYEFAGWEPTIDIATKEQEYKAIFTPKEKVQLIINIGDGNEILISVPKGERPEPPRDYPEREGYDFVGYYQDEACTIPYGFDPLYENKTIYCKWNIIQYKIKWLIDGNTEEEIVNYGVMPVHATPSKAGYIFTGWTPDVEVAYNNVTYFANFETDPAETTKWAVSFNTMGGSFIEPQIVGDGRYATKPYFDPIKKGYVFDGWYDNVDCTGSQFSFNTAITADKILYAKWNIKKYNITFKELKDQGSSVVESVVTEAIPYGTLPNRVPEVQGYTFVGWKPSLVPVTEDATYIADYIENKPDDNYHIISFDARGGTASPSYVIVVNNETITAPPVPERTGYTFVSWYDNAECTGTPFDFSLPITVEEQVLYAKWDATSHTVKWMDSATELGSATYAYGEMPDWGKDCGDNVYKPDYIFIGWEPNIEPVGLEAVYTYEAVYTPLVKEKVFVSFDTRGGSYINTQAVCIGDKAATPSVIPIKAGYTFTDWYKNEACTQIFSFDTEIITANTTIYAGWEQNTTTAYWLKEGVIIASNSCVYGTVPTLPVPETEFNKTGYVRTGWSPTPQIIDENSGFEVYYQAVYSESTDGRKWVTFDTRGGSAITSQHVIIGNQAIKPANPTMKNYEFKDWYVNIECTYPYDFYTPVTDDITIYAGWTYKPEPIPAPTPTPTSRSRNSGGGGSGGGSVSRGLGNGLNNTKENAIACQKTGIMNVPANNFWIYNQIDNTWSMCVVVDNITARLTDGFYKVNDQVYYFDIYGRLTTGWVKDLLGNYFYFEPKDNSNMCAMATGYRTIDGKNYNFGLDGVLLSSN